MYLFWIHVIFWISRSYWRLSCTDDSPICYLLMISISVSCLMFITVALTTIITGHLFCLLIHSFSLFIYLFISLFLYFFLYLFIHLFFNAEKFHHTLARLESQHAQFMGRSGKPLSSSKNKAQHQYKYMTPDVLKHFFGKIEIFKFRNFEMYIYCYFIFCFKWICHFWC